VHIQRIISTGFDKRPHCNAGISIPPVSDWCEDPIYFQSIRMLSAPGKGGHLTVREGSKNAIDAGVTSGLMVIGPELIGKRKFH
jgi:hypothetical protein